MHSLVILDMDGNIPVLDEKSSILGFKTPSGECGLLHWPWLSYRELRYPGGLVRVVSGLVNSMDTSISPYNAWGISRKIDFLDVSGIHPVPVSRSRLESCPHLYERS
jgi:hypothetical protein